MFDDDDKTVDKKKDQLILDYDTILKESALLTTFAGILFGFLLKTHQKPLLLSIG
jgi:hypothetical protein